MTDSTQTPEWENATETYLATAATSAATGYGILNLLQTWTLGWLLYTTLTATTATIAYLILRSKLRHNQQMQHLLDSPSEDYLGVTEEEFDTPEPEEPTVKEPELNDMWTIPPYIRPTPELRRVCEILRYEGKYSIDFMSVTQEERKDGYTLTNYTIKGLNPGVFADGDTPIIKTLESATQGKWGHVVLKETDEAMFRLKAEFPSPVFPTERFTDFQGHQVPYFADNPKKAALIFPSYKARIGVDENGHTVSYSWKDQPHALVIGGTGSGKSVFFRNLIEDARYSGVQVFVSDGKGPEYTMLRTVPNIRAVATSSEPWAIIKVAELVLAEMRARTKATDEAFKLGITPATACVGGTSDFPPILFVIDEWAETKNLIIGTYGKEYWESFLVTIRSLLKVGRSLNIRLVIASQEINADTIPTDISGSCGAIISLGVTADNTYKYAFRNETMQRVAKSIGGAISPNDKGRGIMADNDTNQVVEFQSYLFYSPGDAKMGNAASLTPGLEECKKLFSDRVKPLYSRLWFKVDENPATYSLPDLQAIPTVELTTETGDTIASNVCYDPANVREYTGEREYFDPFPKRAIPHQDGRRAATLEEAIRKFPDYNLRIGVDKDGQPVAFPTMRYNHMLVIGDTGSGKSVFLRNLIEDARNAGWLVNIIDGKGAEFILCRSLPNVGCVATFEDLWACVGLNDLMVTEMARRQKLQAENARTNRPTIPGGPNDFSPLFYIIDEWENLTTTIESQYGKKGRLKFESQVGQIVKVGRSLNIRVVIATQSLSARAIPTPIRDRCQVTVCLGKPRPEVYLNAFTNEERPVAKQIGNHITRKQAGRGIVKDETRGTIVEFQSYYFFTPADGQQVKKLSKLEQNDPELFASKKAISDTTVKMHPRFWWRPPDRDTPGAVNLGESKDIEEVLKYLQGAYVNLDGRDLKPDPAVTMYDPNHRDYMGVDLGGGGQSRGIGFLDAPQSEVSK